jgi:hypothetical protein
MKLFFTLHATAREKAPYMQQGHKEQKNLPGLGAGSSS